MKLAEALQERSSLKKTISGLREKLEKAAEGKEKQTENPMKLLSELDRSLYRMEHLVAVIGHTNELVKVNGKTMTEMIAARDTLFFRLELYKKLIRQAGAETNQLPSGMNVPELQKKADNMLLEIRSLDQLIQKTNWTRELVE